MSPGQEEKIPSSVLLLSTSILPVEEPIKTFTPHTWLKSVFRISARVSFAAHIKKELFANELRAQISYFSSSSFCVSVFGTVFGISIKEVTPPATAALDSVKISALCVRPGSRKWTWSSIQPGKRYKP